MCRWTVDAAMWPNIPNWTLPPGELDGCRLPRFELGDQRFSTNVIREDVWPFPKGSDAAVAMTAAISRGWTIQLTVNICGHKGEQ